MINWKEALKAMVDRVVMGILTLLLVLMAASLALSLFSRFVEGADYTCIDWKHPHPENYHQHIYSVTGFLLDGRTGVQCVVKRSSAGAEFTCTENSYPVMRCFYNRKEHRTVCFCVEEGSY